MKSHVLHHIRSITIVLITVLLCSGCTGNRLPGDNKVIQVVNDVPVLNLSFSELVKKADVIVIGQAVQAAGQVNLAREPANFDQPDPKRTAVGQVYRIQVEQWLKGKGEPEIFFALFQGDALQAQEPVASGETVWNSDGSGDIPLTLGQKYLFFLVDPKHKLEGYEKGTIFLSSGHPTVFDVSNPGYVQIEDQYIDLVKYFPPRSLEEIINLIEKADQGNEQGASKLAHSHRSRR